MVNAVFVMFFGIFLAKGLIPACRQPKTALDPFGITSTIVGVPANVDNTLHQIEFLVEDGIPTSSLFRLKNGCLVE